MNSTKSLENYRGDFKEFLDETTRFYETDWDQKAHSVFDSLARLDCALRASYLVFGRDAFKKWLGDKPERVINRAIFDCIARFFAEPQIENVVTAKRVHIVNAFHRLCLDPQFKDAIEKTPKTVHATFTRIEMWGMELANVLKMEFDQAQRRIV